MFRNKTLDDILSSFERVSKDLSTHIEKKTHEQLELLADKSWIEDLIDDTKTELDRADRVYAKVKEFLS